MSHRALDGSDASNGGGVWNIWRVDEDGTGLNPLTKTTDLGATSEHPQWSPDGAWAAFDSERNLDGTDSWGDEQSNIWRIKPDGSGMIPITKATGGSTHSVYPAWSPDGTRLAFLSQRAVDGSNTGNANGTANIWRVNVDGSGLIPLTTFTAVNSGCHSFDSCFGIWNLKWSPDGKQLAFYSNLALNSTDALNANGTDNIWRINADGKDLKPLTKFINAGSWNPDWSRDGTQIIFSSNRALDLTDAKNTNGTYNIWRMNTDGTGLKSLTTSTVASSGSPRWSPKGLWIVFVSYLAFDLVNALGTKNIWRMNFDGTGLKPLTKATAKGADSAEPSWSRDASWIGFSSLRALNGADASNGGGPENIWRVDVDGTGLKPLTKATAVDARSVSPDVYTDPPVPQCTVGEPNGCGGCGWLSANPGTACKKANQCGTWQCLDTNKVFCDTSNPAPNSCGGCAALLIPQEGGDRGQPCIYKQTFEGVWVCDKGGGSLICCPKGTVGPGCGPE